ncbi:MAG TPA: pyrroloquinoline quinone biosynthesis peptide chaperone PqqD, partial [Reyranella sp.]
MERLEVSATSVLRLAPHIVFRFDETRQRWIMMAPERLMLPDEQAVEILKLVDGKASVDAIVDTLAARFN